MADIEYIMERRARKLADAIRHRIELLVDLMKEPGRRPVFTKKMSEREALAWWRQHRNDELGMKVIANMRPEQTMALDRALSDQIEAERMAPAWPST